MFDIGWSEMAIVLLVALIVIGPKDLPRVARNMGQWAAKGRAMAREFQRALEDMAREAELDKVKSEIEKAGRTDLGKTIEKTIDPSGELSRAFDPPALGGKPAAGAQPAGAPATPATAAAPPAQPEAARDGRADTAGHRRGRAAAERRRGAPTSRRAAMRQRRRRRSRARKRWRRRRSRASAPTAPAAPVRRADRARRRAMGRTPPTSARSPRRATAPAEPS